MKLIPAESFVDELRAEAKKLLNEEKVLYKNHLQPPTKPAKIYDPKPSTMYLNTTGLCDICIHGRLCDVA